MSPRIDPTVRRDLLAALPGWLTARVLVVAAWILATISSDTLGGLQPEGFRAELMSWDGAFYNDIARVGYDELPRQALRFFPLFPLLGRVLSYPLFGEVDLALLLTANALALVAAMLLHRLVLFETADESLARRAAWFVAVFPSSFVLVWGYSEPLMLTAAIASFLALRQHQWERAGVFAMLAALSRPIGLLLVIPILIEALPGAREADRGERLRRLVALAGPSVGIALYSAYTWLAFDDWRAPWSTQSQFRGSLVDPVTRLGRGFGDLFGTERLGDGLHLPFAILFVVLLVVVFRRWPLPYGAFAAGVLLLSVSADNLNSLERYGLNAFPLVLGLATLTSHESVDRVASAAATAGFVSLTVLAFLGAYVP